MDRIPLENAQNNFIFFLLLTVFIFIHSKKYKKEPMEKPRLGISIDLTTTVIDPADINNINKAIISDNLYARLIADEDGQLVSWLADSFRIDENKIILNLGEHYTSSGNLITSEDVALSLKRLIILNTNTHAKLEKFLNIKNETTLNKLDKVIQSVSKNQLVIHTQSKNTANLLLKILSSGEYGIIPKSAIDNKTLKITNNSETTGAFYLNKKASVILKKNKNFINSNQSNYSDEIEIINVPTSSKALDYFLEDKIDILPTSVNLDLVNAEKLKQYNIFYTDKFKLFLIAFGPSIYKKTSVLERHYLIEQFKILLEKTYPFPTGTELANQFLSKNGDGHLSPEQIEDINKFKSSSKINILNKKIVFQSYKGLENNMKSLFQIKNLDVKFEDDFPPEQPYKQRPDSYFAMGDVSFNTDYTLLSYYLESQIISISKKEADHALSEFLKIENDADRVKFINELHYKIVKDAAVGPLFLAPYTIVTKKPLVSTQTKLSASTKLWKIVRSQ